MKTLTTRKKSVILSITIVSIAILLTGCADTTEQSIENPVVDVMPETDTIAVITEPDKPEAVATKVYIGDERHLPLRPKPIDENDENVTPPVLVTNVDKIGNHIADSDIEKIEETIGKPVAINDANTDRTVESRYYQIDDDNNMVDMFVVQDSITMFLIRYRHGYETSLEAVVAAGFKAEQLTLKSQAPQEMVNGAVKLAQDLYSADTPNRHYKRISAFRNTKGLWNMVNVNP